MNLLSCQTIDQMMLIFLGFDPIFENVSVVSHFLFLREKYNVIKRILDKEKLGEVVKYDKNFSTNLYTFSLREAS